MHDPETSADKKRSWKLATSTVPAATMATGRSERLHALDAVRAGALMLGVLFHSSLSFMVPAIWLIPDRSTSPVMDSTYFILHIFRMSVFFFIAGFFARLVLHRRGVRGFVRNRSKRILLPLFVFWPVIMVTTVLAQEWWGIKTVGHGPKAPPMTVNNFPLTDLWFLYVLVFFYLGLLAVRGLAGLVDRSGAGRARLIDPVVGFVVRRHLTPVALGIPLFAVFMLTPSWEPWYGVEPTENGLIPNAPAVVTYAVAFIFGYLMHRQPDLLKEWERRCLATLGLAVALTVVLMVIVGVDPTSATWPADGKKIGYAALYALAIWVWGVALVGLGMRYLSKPNPRIRYLSDASYWIYVMQLPVVMFLEAALGQLAVPWYVKYPFIVVVTFAVLLFLYRYLVRYTWIGAMMNGRRTRPAKQPVGETPVAALAE